MVLTLWVCRDPEGWGPEEEIVFYRKKADAYKRRIGGTSKWYWDLDEALGKMPAKEILPYLKKAGLTLKLGEGPKKVKITIEEVK